MKKNKTILITLSILFFILLSIIGFFIYKYIQNNNIYSNIIKANWDIELSSNYNELYSHDSGNSFHGDGERYHIFQYNDINDISNSLDWKIDKDSTIEFEIQNIISKLNIPIDYLPNFENKYKYYFKSNIDSSVLYIIFDIEDKKIYVIEHFQ